MTTRHPTYDAAGNMTFDGVNTYLYDAESRVCAVHGPFGMTGYQYDADGNRIGKGSITSMSCDLTANGYQAQSEYVLDAANGSEVWQHTNVTAGGALIATYDTTGLHFYLNDALGTRRAQTDAYGVLEQTCQSLPFGDGLNCSLSNAAPTEHHFTGKERDAESGLDYFGARYYGSNMGRFMSPDWSAQEEPVPYASLSDPQSLNLYQYVRNNPLSSRDPDGHCCDDDDSNDLAGDTLHGSGVGGDIIKGAAKGTWNLAAGGVNLVSDLLFAGIEDRPQLPTATYSNPAQNIAGDVTQLGLIIGDAVGALKGGGTAPKTETDPVPPSIPAGPSPTPTAAQQRAINAMGDAHGCHECGAKSPGTKSGNWVGDHHPATSQNPTGAPQVYKPHCLTCSLRQGGRIRAKQMKAAAAAKKNKVQP